MEHCAAVIQWEQFSAFRLDLKKLIAELICAFDDLISMKTIDVNLHLFEVELEWTYIDVNLIAN